MPKSEISFLSNGQIVAHHVKCYQNSFSHDQSRDLQLQRPRNTGTSLETIGEVRKY